MTRWATRLLTLAVQTAASLGVGFCTSADASQQPWQIEANARSFLASFSGPPTSTGVPSTLTVACYTSDYEAPNITLTIRSDAIPSSQEVPVVLSRGNASLPVTMSKIDGSPYGAEYSWTTEDMHKISPLEDLFPDVIVGAPLLIRFEPKGPTLTFDDTVETSAAGLSSDIIHRCSPASTSAAAEVESMTNINNLEVMASDADDQCSGDDDLKQCDRRSVIDSRLNELGQCYGEQGQDDADMTWHACDANSYRQDLP